MDVKKMGEKELQGELAKASRRLALMESEYVNAQNACESLEGELKRRQEAEDHGVQKVALKDLSTKWVNKARDIEKAADAYKDDPKSRHSLMMQVDLLQSCLSDLKRLMDSPTASTRT